ncbi:hypothetical protein AOQ84DRAFT_422845 [Glonium stellatum]|uniref:BTB domain-containing protein n=1 Tax=Glonium stellatum TaxID=574774 RepID=A0A8E2EPU6_9PEZI|nr:hypothetical protein AOQ84DRAFT_422845 [Glonium stellatum]
MSSSITIDQSSHLSSSSPPLPSSPSIQPVRRGSVSKIAGPLVTKSRLPALGPSNSRNRVIKAASQGKKGVPRNSGFLSKLGSIINWPEQEQETFQDVITLDKKGDVCFILRAQGSEEGKTKVLASSSALCLASPIWKRLLDRSPVRSSKNPQILQLLNDDAEALLFVLQVVHLKHRDLPVALTYEQIVRLAVVCSKYNTAAVVRPFLSERLAPHEHRFIESGREEWLYVAWTFGFVDDFEKLVNHLIRHSRTDDQQCLLNGVGDILDGRFPHGILRFISSTRAEYIASLLKTSFDFLGKLLGPSQAKCQFAGLTDDDNALRCIDLICGTFVRELHALGIGPPRPDVSLVYMSVEELSMHLKSIRFHTYGQDIVEADASGETIPAVHGKCLQDLLWEHIIDSALVGLPAEIPMAHKRHMILQVLK